MGTASSTDDISPRVHELIEETGRSISEGRLPLEVLNNQEIYELELERIFSRSWVYVGHESELTEPGDYARRYIAKDPFIFVRDEQGELHVFFDSCCHRGAQFARAERGNTSHFRCPYHGWTYRNDGTLQGMPNKREAYKELDPDEVRLKEAEVETFCGLVFAKIADGGPSLEEYLGDIKWYLEMTFGLTEGGMTVVGEPHRWVSDHDWKTSAENLAGDSYHVATSHQSGMETDFEESIWGEIDSLASDSYMACTDRHSMGYYVTDEEEVFMDYPEKLREHLDPDLDERQREIMSRSVFHFGNVFPHMSIHHGVQVGGWGGPWASIRVSQPRGPGRTETTSWWLVPKELADDEEFKRKSRSGFQSLGPAGAFDADDLAAWDGISESAGGMTTREQRMKGDVRMGMGDMSDVERVDDPFHGPAEEVIHGGPMFDEEHTRTLFEHWHECMAN